MRKLPIIVVLGGFCLANTYSDSAETLERKQRESLRGLGGIYLVVEDLKPEVQRDGLTRSDLLKEVEEKLRAAGIQILSRDDWPKTLGAPYLYVNVQTVSVRGPTGAIYSLSINVSLEQTITLVRDPSLITSAPTWESNMIGLIGKEKLSGIISVVGDLVEKFAKDYLAVNPRRGKEGVQEPKI